jgi:hypothetical protein
MNSLRMCLGLFVAGVLVSCGVMDENPGSRPDAVEPPSVRADPGEPPSLRTDTPFELGASVADGEVSAAASEIVDELDGEEQFASVEVIDRQRIFVRWFGEPTPHMQNVIGRFPHLDITVDQVSCSPGHVQRFGSDLLESRDARAFSLAPDGPSVDVMLDEALRETSDVFELERRYSEAADCPVKVTFGSIQPAL